MITQPFLILLAAIFLLLLPLTAAQTCPVAGEFNPIATDILATYYGHSLSNFYNASLLTLCNSSAIDIVVLGFIRQWNGISSDGLSLTPTTLPSFDISPDCQYNTSSKTRQVSCPGFAAEVLACQEAGKKVFLSVGGSVSQAGLPSEGVAVQAAELLWGLFGGGSAQGFVRPFGEVVLDGFDIDLEQESTAHYSTFAATLRTLMTTTTTNTTSTSLTSSTSKQYYLSISPSCAMTAYPYLLSIYTYMDFVWPRFYNTYLCSAGTSNFASTLYAWQTFLDNCVGTANPFPRLLIGALAFNKGAGYYGFLPPVEFAEAAVQASCAVRRRFGGVNAWDGTEGLRTMAEDGSGLSWVQVVKRGLTEEAVLTGQVASGGPMYRPILLNF